MPVPGEPGPFANRYWSGAPGGPALTPLAAVAEAARILGEHPAEPVRTIGVWLIERQPADLIAALGFESAPGFSAPLALALGERDRLLREHAAAIYPDLPPAQQARLIAPLLLRYRATRWLHDRTAAACPYEPDDQRIMLWRVLRLADRAISERRLRSILAA